MANLRLPAALLSAALSLSAMFATAQSAFVPGAPATGVALADTRPNRVLDTASQGAVAQIKGHIPQWATAANDAGAIPETQQVQLIIGLSRAPEVEAALVQLQADQQTPGSARYHQWLTPQQVGEQYGPTQHDVDAVTAWLAGQGITVGAVTASRTFIQASASAAVVAHAFSTSLHNYRMANGTLLQAPAAEPSVPAALSPVIGYIDGLTNVPRHTHNVQGDAASTAAAIRDVNARIATAAGAPANSRPDVNLTGGYHALLPADFTAIYDLQPAYTAGTNGAGQRIAIIGGSDLLASDVSNYEAFAGLANYSPTTIVPPSTSSYTFSDPGYSTSDQTEGMLDFERAYGTAPGAGIDFIISKNWLTGVTSQGLLLYAINTVNDPVLSLSFGACEALQTSAYIQQENSMFLQAASQGISVMVSSGDAGAEGCAGLTTQSTLYASISDLCASSYVTCVGGTEFNDVPTTTFWSSTNGTNYGSALSYIPEGAWNDPQATSTTYQAASSGGGFSTNIAKPTWQVATGVPADGHRDVPDISFSGSLHNAYPVCQAAAGSGTGCTPGSIGFIVVGGTSASAPSMAGVAALIDQKLKGRQGNLNPLLYSLYGKSPAAFHDVTPTSSGASTNGVCAVTSPSLCNNSVPTTTTSLTPVVTGYPVTTGYDETTGLGSLDVNAFLTAAGLPTPTGTITATPTTATITQTAVFTATFTAPSGTTSTPTGTVQFFANGVALGGTVTLTNGQASSAPASLSPAGTFAITATYSGDANFSPTSSATLNFIVTNPNAIPSASALSITPTGTLTTQQQVTYSIAVTGARAIPTGTVSFLDGGLIRQTSTLSATGTATFTTLNGLAAGTHNLTCSYSGDAVYAASSCNTVTVTVNAIPTTLAAVISPTAPAAGGSLTLTFTVGNPTAGVPTGNVAVYQIISGSSPLLLQTVQLQGTNIAAATFTAIPAGAYSFNGVYSGDTIFTGSTSPTVAVTISGFGMTATPTSLSITDGATTGNTVSVGYTSYGGFAGTITQGCSLYLSSGTATNAPTCNITPSSVTLASGASATATVTVLSAAAHSELSLPPSFNRDRALGGVAFAGLLLVLLPTRRKLLRNWRALALLLLACTTLMTLSGCGSSSSSTSFPGTTKGTYVLTISAQSGSQSNTITENVTLN